MKLSDIWFEIYLVNLFPNSLLMHILNAMMPINQQLPNFVISITSVIMSLTMTVCECKIINYFKRGK